MLKAQAFSEVKTEASARNHLVISLHHALALEVREIEKELVQVWAKFVSQIVRFFSRRA